MTGMLNISLVVEDSDILRSALIKFLSGRPHFAVVGEAHDGEVAIQLIEKLDPDLLLLDLHMPKLDGWQVLRYLQERQAHHKVIIFSSHVNTGLGEATLGHGVIASIYKGNLLALVSTLDELTQAIPTPPATR